MPRGDLSAFRKLRHSLIMLFRGNPSPCENSSSINIGIEEDHNNNPRACSAASPIPIKRACHLILHNSPGMQRCRPGPSLLERNGRHLPVFIPVLNSTQRDAVLKFGECLITLRSQWAVECESRRSICS